MKISERRANDMIDQLTAILSFLGDWLYAWFIAPGSYLLSKFAAIAPATAFNLGISAGQNEGTLVIMLSLACWLLLLFALGIARTIVRSWLRLASAMVLTAWHRVKLAASGYKTRLVLKLKSLLPRRYAKSPADLPTVEFDDLDLEVLHLVSEQGPGFALSAPELAEKMSLLPSRIQESLDKLNRNNMLKSVIASTDGFDNYSLSETGAAFVSMWQRQESRG